MFDGSDTVIILDGALATELEERGANIDDPLWSAKILLEDPALIQELHYDYFVAGADVAITASYQATFEGFAQRGYSHAQAADLMQLSVRLAQAARDDFWAQAPPGRRRPLVAASVGSYGAFLADGSEYTGDYGLSRSKLMDFHRERMATLLSSGPDLLACETIPCQIEGEALVELLAEFPDSRAWLSFSCCDETHVCHGEPFAECVRITAESPQVVAVGINCTAPDHITPLLESAAGISDKPLVVYPNRGELWDALNHRWTDGTGITDFGAMVQTWHRHGARFIGGCCRTTPHDIHQMAQALATYR
ncbi:MAG: homocysteine S-methyltransferase [Okeania sp. SIO3B3]|nr:homocysteine S-methyltransferase [Okeania sp. SIO3B3]